MENAETYTPPLPSEEEVKWVRLLATGEKAKGVADSIKTPLPISFSYLGLNLIARTQRNLFLILSQTNTLTNGKN
jgi:hypothetical protein